MTAALTDQVTIITGASSGIGRAIALAAGRLGAKVVAVGRSEARLGAVSDAIVGEGGVARFVACDISSEEEVATLFRKVEEDLGGVDILINNAGTITSAPIERMTLADWNSVIAVNLTGSFLCMRSAIASMKPRRCGRILNVGSISSVIPRPHTAAYAASKAGLVGLARAAAIETRPYGIAVGCLHPGNVATEMRQSKDDPMNQEPMMSVDEVANLAMAMLAVEPSTVVWELTALPVAQSYLARG